MDLTGKVPTEKGSVRCMFEEEAGRFEKRGGRWLASLRGAFSYKERKEKGKLSRETFSDEFDYVHITTSIFS